MKKTNQLRNVLLCVMLFWVTLLSSQEKEKPSQFYLTVTTMHWNMDLEDFSMKDWIAIEKEFLDKVTKKNEFVLAATTAHHYLTADNREVLYVQLFSSWEAIEKAADRSDELIKEAWPNEVDRDAYFKKRGAYYSDFHSDEIYATFPGGKSSSSEAGDDIFYYVRKSHFAFPDEGSRKEFEALRNAYLKDVVHKNKYLKGYFPYVHAWGSDKRDFVEVFEIESLTDLEKAFEETGRLNKARFADEDKMKAESKKIGKYFTGFHADYVYKAIPELRKIREVSKK